MNELVNIATEQTMSSLQIAEITGKEHKNVMRDIRNLLEQGVSQLNFELSSYQQPQPNGGYKEVACYNLTKTGCLILASGYNALLREKIINRWIELETANTPQVPKSFKEALLLAAAQQEQIEEQQKLIGAQAVAIESKDKTIAKLQPKADFADTAFSSDTLISMSQAAKILKLPFGRNTLYKKLKEDGIFFKNKNEPLQRFVDAKYFRLVEGYPIETSKGLMIPVVVYCTQKGLAYINLKYGNKDSNIPQLAKIK